MDKKEFQNKIREFYKKNGRDLPWRKDVSFYSIVVSEIMLQQTQVNRVIEKYNAWMEKFKDFEALEKANLEDVLKIWQGLGYNRRALWLKQIADKIIKDHKEPRTIEELKNFPGIGKNTAGSIAAFAFNYPSIFIETNIRRVYIYHFFNTQKTISDNDLLPIIEETLDRENPKEWYYALMDYGTYLASIVDNPNKQSKHYSKQSKFEGSKRSLRGEVLRHILNNSLHIHELKKLVEKHKSIDMFQDVIDELIKEKFIVIKDDILSIYVSNE